MAPYETEYPGIVLVQDDSVEHTLTFDDNQQRILITETDENLDHLKQVFTNEGFRETILEIEKPHQIGNGFLKTLSDDWDMHIRFIQLHDGLIAIDGEVETSRKWIEHVTKNNWISVIYEITNILKKYKIDSYLWHKKIEKYVVSISKQMNIKLHPLGSIQSNYVIAAGVIAFIGLACGIKKYQDSKNKKR